MVLPPTIRQLLRSPLPLNLPKSTATTVSGWIKSIRKQKNVSFAVITDGSSTKGLQAVLVKGDRADDEDLLRRYLFCFLIYMQYISTYTIFFFFLLRLTNGVAVRLTGRLVSSPGKEQSCELLVDQNDVGKVDVLGECDPEASPLKVLFFSNIELDQQKVTILDIPYSKENTNIRISTRPCTSTYAYT